jgi:hypothetical protein
MGEYAVKMKSLATVGCLTLLVAPWLLAQQPTADKKPATSAKDKAPPSDNKVSPSADAKKQSPKPETKPEPARIDDLRPKKKLTAKDILSAFEKDRPVNSPRQARNWELRPTRSGSPGDAPALLREGEYLHNRAGRISRDGLWWKLTFESGGSEAGHASIRLLPNQQLERIILEHEASKESPVFLLSGEVTMFDSQNYLLVRTSVRRSVPQNLER